MVRPDSSTSSISRVCQITKDGAGGGPAEEQTCVLGRGMRLLKIGESRTRKPGRDDNFRMDPLSGI